MTGIVRVLVRRFIAGRRGLEILQPSLDARAQERPLRGDLQPARTRTAILQSRESRLADRDRPAEAEAALFTNE